MSNKITIKSMRFDYDVLFVEDFKEILKDLLKLEKCSFLIDKNIWEQYHLAELLPSEKCNIILIEAIEANKTIYTVIDVWKRWENANIIKKSKIIVIGGGILQDIGAFASSAYLRNIDWYFFPTTLLAQCDSCIGSKCGINLDTFKNQIGTFYPPKNIYIDTNFLDTLTEENFYSGMGEIFKASLTSDRTFFNDLQKSLINREDRAIIKELIYRSLIVKKAIIEVDEFEKDYRRILNYGHSFGHALEAYSKNEIPHGAAVTLGIDIANYIAYRKGFLTENEFKKAQEIARIIYRFPFPDNIDVERLFHFMRRDKKSDGNSINLIIPAKLGKLQIYPMQLDSNLADLLASYFRENHALYRN